MDDRNKKTPPPFSRHFAAAAPENDAGPAEKQPDEEKELRLGAGFWLRVGAFLLDALILEVLRRVLGAVLGLTAALGVAAAGVLRLLAGRAGLDPAAANAGFVAAAVLMFVAVLLGLLLIGTLYHALFESSRLKASPGKLAFRIYVVTYEGERCSFLRAFMRNLLKILSYLTLGLGFTMAGYSLRNQALHDLLSNTLVVRKRDFRLAQVLPSILFVASVYLTIIAVRYQPAEKPKTEKPRPVHHVIERSPSDVVLPPERGIGHVTLGDVQIPFEAVFLRQQAPMLSPGAFKAAGKNSGLIEAALFTEPLTDEEREKLKPIPSLLSGSAAVVGKRPAALIELVTPEDLASCVPESLLEAALTVQAPGTDGQPLKVPFSPVTLGEQGFFTLQCRELTAGSSVLLSLQRKERVAGAPLTVNVRFTAPLESFETLGHFTYENYEDVAAIWHSGQGMLEIAFLDVPFTPAVLQHILQKHAAPNAVLRAELPLRPGLQRARHDDVRSGYRLIVQSGEGRPINLTGAEEYVINFPSGQRPTSLAAQLGEGRRAIGRLEGSHVFSLPAGIVRFEWSLPYNAPVVVVP